jgi:hypothetical protein
VERLKVERSLLPPEPAGVEDESLQSQTLSVVLS